jgi:hypothetical protein
MQSPVCGLHENLLWVYRWAGCSLPAEHLSFVITRAVPSQPQMPIKIYSCILSKLSMAGQVRKNESEMERCAIREQLAGVGMDKQR